MHNKIFKSSASIRRAQALGAALIALNLCLPPQEAQAKKKTKNVEAEAEQVKIPDDPGCVGCIGSASSLFAKNHPQEAAELLRGWLDKCPNNLQLRLLLHTVLSRLPKAKEEALAIARQAIAIAPDSMLAHFQAAMTLLTMGNNSGAAAEFEKVVAIDPSNYDAWISLSDLYGSLNQGDKAQEASVKAASLSPSSKQARISTLLTMSRAGNVSGVRNQFKQLLNGSDAPMEAFADIGDQALSLGFYQEAQQFFNRFCEQFPKSSNGRYKQLLTLYLTGENQATLDGLLDDANNLRISDSTSALLALEAMCDVSAGQLSKAREQANTAAQIDGKQALVPFAQGLIAYKNGDYREARGALNSAANKEKALYPARILLVRMSLKNGEAMEAAAAAHDLRKVPGVAAQALALELMASLRQDEVSKNTVAGLKEEATRMLAALAEGSEKVNRAVLHLALVREALAANNLSEAKSQVSKAAADNRDEETLLAEADVALAEGNGEAAQNALEQALLLAPGDIEVLSQLGILLTRAGQARGEALITKAAGEGELNAQASFIAAKFFEHKGKNQEAIKLYQSSLEKGLNGPDKLIARDALKKLVIKPSAPKTPVAPPVKALPEQIELKIKAEHLK